MGYVKDLVAQVYGGGQDAVDACLSLVRMTWVPCDEVMPHYGALVLVREATGIVGRYRYFVGRLREKESGPDVFDIEGSNHVVMVDPSGAWWFLVPVAPE